MNFEEYLKKQIAMRSQSWTSKARRFADKHTQLEDIRKEVFLPLDYNASFNMDDLIRWHFTGKNPLILWDKGVFSFSEEGIRAAMKAKQADMDSFRMESSHESIEGKEAPLPESRYDFRYNVWKDYPSKPNKLYDFGYFYFDWLRRVYRISTDIDTVRLAYRQVSMTIRRYSNADRPFGYYELNPCEQLCHGVILIQETEFYTLDIADLLEDMACEWELRQEELNFYAKKLKVRTMEAAVTEGLEFTVWDEKKLKQKTAEYIGKGYPLDKVMEQVFRSWKSSVKKFFSAAEERALTKPDQTLSDFCDFYGKPETFAKKVFCPYIKKSGLDGVEVETSDYRYAMTIKYQGAQCHLYQVYSHNIVPTILPDTNVECVSLPLSADTPLSAIVEYLKLMPETNPKIEEAVEIVMKEYDRLVNSKEEFRADREFLEDLMGQHAGKPVGKLLKYMRWEVARLHPNESFRSPFPFQTLKILGDRSFSFERKDNSTSFHWLDKDCHYVFPFDPETTDIKKWKKTHRGIIVETVWSFFEHGWYMPSNASSIVSIDYVDRIM